MTKKDFFRLIIKVFGLYWLVSVLFSALPSNIVYVLQAHTFNQDFGAFGYLWIFAVALITILLFVFLVLKPDLIIKLLKLDKGFDDDRIEVKNFDALNILKMALIVIGGILIINNISPLLSHGLFYVVNHIQKNNGAPGYEFNFKDYSYLSINALNIIVGYLLLKKYDKISKSLIHKENNIEE